MDISEKILSLSDNAAVRYNVKKILGYEIEPELLASLSNSKWVKLLSDNQNKDGGYGRFHTQNTKIKQKFPTTEHTVDSMYLLGLQRGIPLVDKLCDYIEKLFSGDVEWPDGYERNEWYKPAQPVFLASKLSVFGSDNAEYIKTFDIWHTILQESFHKGKFDADRSKAIGRKIFNIDIVGSACTSLDSLYFIDFFANMQSCIDDGLKRDYLKWLHESKRVIPYTNCILSNKLDNKLTSLYRVYFSLSKFPNFKEEFSEELVYLRKQQSQEGFWNFGKKFMIQKLADDWRTKQRMDIDHTIRMLQLLK